MAYLFEGKAFAQAKEEQLKKRVMRLKKRGITPKLAAILVGDNPASKIYVNLKKKAAERIGIVLQLTEVKKAEKEKLLHLIEVANNDRNVHGIMLQLPLPEELRQTQDLIVSTIDTEKDVDGLRDDPGFPPATVKAVLYAIEEAQKQGFLSSAWNQIHTVVIGAAGMVGKPLSDKLEKLGAQVIKYDKILPASQGVPLRSYSKNADLLISAAGHAGLIEKDMVKKGAVVIDVGAPKSDVAEDVQEVASFITPVPGGIGPVTVACLLENLVEAAEKSS